MPTVWWYGNFDYGTHKFIAKLKDIEILQSNPDSTLFKIYF